MWSLPILLRLTGESGVPYIPRSNQRRKRGEKGIYFYNYPRMTGSLELPPWLLRGKKKGKKDYSFNGRERVKKEKGGVSLL